VYHHERDDEELYVFVLRGGDEGILRDAGLRLRDDPGGGSLIGKFDQYSLLPKFHKFDLVGGDG
jgi:hypothetical protein